MDQNHIFTSNAPTWSTETGTGTGTGTVEERRTRIGIGSRTEIGNDPAHRIVPVPDTVPDLALPTVD